MESLEQNIIILKKLNEELRLENDNNKIKG
jgi:hypothetical protein